MSIVLDTNALVWAFENDGALGGRAKQVIDEAVFGSAVHVSAISFWELALKIRKGKFGLDRPIVEWRAGILSRGVREVAIEGMLGIAANQLADFHDDPADRLIVATALRLAAPLVTSDARILGWKGPLVSVDARV